jgi:outer membrane protein OmpA-like peptidoglycan-associated protein
MTLSMMTASLSKRSAMGLLGGLALLGMIGTAGAQEAPLSADAIVEALDPGPADAAAPQGLARSLGGAEALPRRRRVDLTIFFDPDSARITRRSRVQLEPLGRALQSPRLARRSFTIIGHTDAIGSPGYNRNLSLRRAKAVRAYLAEAYQISGRRLAVRGMGADQLKDPNDPGSDINRRVEVALASRR